MRPSRRLDPGSPGLAQAAEKRLVHFRDVFATLYERLGIAVATTQLTDLAGGPQYLVGDHRPLPELIG